ncbi:hypothetical protein GCK32_019861 [Trichostrongylus colubriformis]|uniref:Uncharacterized protein n=1 Tax=Trichostrongylus colubriformis TaxID=6319 RepID=A0AAN8IUV0_TRICO
MAFGGLLDGFLADNHYGAPTRGRRLRLQSSRSATIGEMGRMGMKKLSTASTPATTHTSKVSWSTIGEVLLLAAEAK